MIFSIHVRIRQTYHAIADRVTAVLYYHHRTPELIRRDVKGLSKVPKHLSVILELPPERGKKDRLEGLLNDACEIAAWSAGAGVGMLSIYERAGRREYLLFERRRHITDLHRHPQVLPPTPTSPDLPDSDSVLWRNITYQTHDLSSRPSPTILFAAALT